MRNWHEDEIRNEYFIWLCELIGADMGHRSYWMLCKSLYKKEFVWSVPNDDNRASEAKNLRERFCEDIDIEYNLDDFPERASMLELIIALAYRCEEVMADQDDEIPMRDWFWKLMENVGLDRFEDVGSYDSWDGVEVNEILDTILLRTFKRNGQGGLFPLRRSRLDQRKVELWYQMNTYLLENYFGNEGIG